MRPSIYLELGVPHPAKPGGLGEEPPQLMSKPPNPASVFLQTPSWIGARETLCCIGGFGILARTPKPSVPGASYQRGNTAAGGEPYTSIRREL